MLPMVFSFCIPHGSEKNISLIICSNTWLLLFKTNGKKYIINLLAAHVVSEMAVLLGQYSFLQSVKACTPAFREDT